MRRLTGGYPGGPPRHDPQGQGADSDGPELRDGEAVEASSAARVTRTRKKRRNRRLLIGLVTSLMAAASVGVYFGIQNSKTVEDLTQEQMQETGEADLERDNRR